jgi:hypothetical protein
MEDGKSAAASTNAAHSNGENGEGDKDKNGDGEDPNKYKVTEVVSDPKKGVKVMKYQRKADGTAANGTGDAVVAKVEDEAPVLNLRHRAGTQFGEHKMIDKKDGHVHKRKRLNGPKSTNINNQVKEYVSTIFKEYNADSRGK